jgi:hypothetical protein
MKANLSQSRVFIIFLSVLCLNGYCSQQSSESKQNAEELESQNSGSKQQTLPSKKSGSEKFLRFKSYSYIDQQGTGLEAFSFLMPAEWMFEGGMTWLLDNPMMPSVSAFRVFNPKGREEFEVFPNHSFYWTNNNQQMGLFPPGSRYFGSVVKQPVTAQVALKEIVLPEQRGGFQGLIILKNENVPELPAAIGAGQQQAGVASSATGAKLRIRYVSGGVPIEEEFYAVVETMTFPTQGMYGISYNTLWYLDYIFSFKAEAGNLEKNTKIFQTIVSSFKVNPRWYAKYSNIIVYLAQQQITRIRNIGEFSRMLSSMSDQMREENLAQFEARGEVYDRVSRQFSDNILGIDRYYNPHEGREVELPSGYNYAWSNNNGEYIVTDNPDLNPNVGSNLHWELMPKK